MAGRLYGINHPAFLGLLLTIVHSDSSVRDAEEGNLKLSYLSVTETFSISLVMLNHETSFRMLSVTGLPGSVTSLRFSLHTAELSGLPELWLRVKTFHVQHRKQGLLQSKFGTKLRSHFITSRLSPQL